MSGAMSFKEHGHCRVLTDLVLESVPELSASGRARRVDGGEIVYAMGDPTDHVYFVRRGRVKTSALSAEGKELALEFFGPGEVFGELCFCSVRARQEQAVAVEPSEVVMVPASHFVATATSSHEQVERLLNTFCVRLAETRRLVQELAFDPVPRRLARALLRLAEGGDVEGDGVRLRSRVTHEQLAESVAASRELVTTLLNQFRERGVIQYQRGGPIVVDPAKLEQLL